MRSYALVLASGVLLASRVHAQLGGDWDPPAQCAPFCDAFSTAYNSCYELPTEPEQAACFCKDEHFQALAQCGACTTDNADVDPVDRTLLLDTVQSSLTYITTGCNTYNVPVAVVDVATVTYSLPASGPTASAGSGNTGTSTSSPSTSPRILTSATTTPTNSAASTTPTTNQNQTSSGSADGGNNDTNGASVLIVHRTILAMMALLPLLL